MSMTHSENYYTNVMVDKIHDLINEGDTRAFEVIEIHLWHEYVDKLQKQNEILREAVEYAYAQEVQSYGMVESEAIHFRMRKVFSILEESLEKIKDLE